jgi:hypothetical protein
VFVEPILVALAIEFVRVLGVAHDPIPLRELVHGLADKLASVLSSALEKKAENSQKMTLG